MLLDSPPSPVDIVRCPNGDVLLLPAMWPVRLTPEERRAFAADLLAEDQA
ncbi:hypothetical protein ACQPYK_49755 (plasmid) [Streptosporangium sp. CA-135522]